MLLAYLLVKVVIYNLFFHPLANTPGPLLARISVLPSFYHACKGDRHIWIWRNFQVYGDTFRAAPNLVLFNTPRAHADIYAARANTTRSGFYRAWKRGKDDVNTINSIDPLIHARKRKTLNLAFTEQSLKAAGPLMAVHVDRWIELLTSDANESEIWSTPRDMATWIDALVFDILGDLCFGESFDTKEPGENKLKKLPHLIMKQVSIGYMLSKSGLFNLVLWLQPRGLYALQERIRHADVKEYNAFVQGRVHGRIAAHKAGEKATRHDMFHFLLTATETDTNLPAYTDSNHLLAEARLLVLAGTDTSAATLCGLFFYLAHNPRVLAKLNAEIRSTFASVQEIMLGPSLSKCQYLRACIDEALRLAPPAPSELPREVLPGGAVIQGQFYPPGTVVGCSAWSMGRDEAIYGDAYTFRPERWIPSSHLDTLNSEDQVRNLKKIFHPFSTGSSDCAGRNVAMLELLLVCARTVWKTDIRVAPGFKDGEGRPELGWGQRSRDQFIVKDAFLSLKEGPVLQFRQRLE
ncbi:benzoate 4-monooxygenase cytochrome P450 [Melanomma pulvis-pyrius CBS 109.77]|uniref:Benzoate 4-monooxygenase cytochrome P450 n=1 Tax=Melanomma pulvis-pyrius CBS 109.77 TaxID=1314802 RepID=A0A6A6XHV3_9PLEO|nr:benzoate 4-monooxygenase cytochrome P450 [Melanomma pulvis-pyrius CBS 109.77]